MMALTCKNGLIATFVLVTLFLPLTLMLVHDGPDVASVLNYYEIISKNQMKSRMTREAKMNSRYSVKEESFHAFGKDFRLILTPRRGILAHDFEAFRAGGDGVEHKLFLDENIAFEGHVFGEAFSSVQATYEDGRLNAKIVTTEEIYYVEPADRHLNSSVDLDSMIIYRESDIKDVKPYLGSKSNRKSCGGGIAIPDPDNYDVGNQTYPPKSPVFSNFNSSTSQDSDDGVSQKRKRSTKYYKPDKNTCPLLLVADFNFYTHMGKSDVVKTISYLVALIDRVDRIYRATKWNDLGMSGMGFEIKKIIVHDEVDRHDSHYNAALQQREAQEVLEAFSRPKRNQRYCLAHLFTHQGFIGYVLGLAYIGSPRKKTVGGICTKKYSAKGRELFLNTGLSSTLNVAGRRILTREADLVTAHELGHNWGSEHDPDTEECAPKSRQGGSYIMYTYSVSGMERNNQFFSPCSRRSMNAALESKSTDCFTLKSASFCGNHHKEDGEECDAGVQGLDQCCTDKCKLNKKMHAVCSPSNSACCTQTCHFSPKDVVCAREDTQDRTCTGNATCPGNSDQCGKPKAKPKGSPCMERGECNKDGNCLTFCQTKGLISCICPNAGDVCKWCCKTSDNATCEPYTDEASMPLPLIMPEGIPCPFGYCDAKGECRKIKQDMIERFFTIIEKLDSNYVVKIMKRNIVGTILIFSAIIWIPASCIITWVDKKQEEEERQEWEWYMREHFVPASLAAGVAAKVVEKRRNTNARTQAGEKKWGGATSRGPSFQLGPGVHFEGVTVSDWHPETETTRL